MKKRKRKKIIIIFSVFIAIIALCILIFAISLQPAGKSDKKIGFVINKGESKEQIIENLKDANLIRSKYATIVYVVLSGNKNLQAGSYELSSNMNVKQIISALNNGDVIKDKKEEVRITLKEGDTLKKFVTMLADETNIEYDDAVVTLADKEYIQELIDKYWFLTDDILDEELYFPLEGYLYPETYNFYKQTTIKEVNPPTTSRCPRASAGS